jgi:hypothetical protein
MRTPFIDSRAMAMMLALEAMDDAVTHAPHRTRRRVRRTRAAGADERRG